MNREHEYCTPARADSSRARPRGRALCLAAWAALSSPCLAAGPHAGSISQSRVVVTGEQVELQLRCQLLSAVEVLPALAQVRERDQLADTVSAESQRIAAYVAQHFRLAALAGAERTLLEALPAEARASWVEAEGGLLGGLDLIDLRLPFRRAPQAFDALELQVDLFLETSPDHRDLCQIEWRGEPQEAFLFSAYEPIWRWPPARTAWPDELRRFFRQGFLGLWSAGWGLAVLLGLGLASRARALRVVAIFMVAAGAGILAAALPPEGLPLSAHLLQLAVVLSVAYVGADCLLHAQSGLRWIEALAFGAIHGLALGGALGRSLTAAYWRAIPSLGFAAGAASGACLFGLALAGGWRVLAARLSDERLRRLARAPFFLLLGAGLIGFVRLL